MPDDAKARLRRMLAAHDYVNGPRAPVPVEDLREVLRELGELRQRTQQQQRAILTVAEDWGRKGMPMGRIFANAAAEAYRLENATLRLALGLNPEPDFGPIYDAWRTEGTTRAERHQAAIAAAVAAEREACAQVADVSARDNDQAKADYPCGCHEWCAFSQAATSARFIARGIRERSDRA